MESINLAGITLELDRARTAAILAANSNRDSCKCDACTNQRVVSRHFMPEGVAKLLRTAGIDADNAFHRAGRKPQEGKKAGLYWGETYWPIIAIVESSTKSVELAPGVFLKVGPTFRSESALRILEKVGLDKEPNLLFLKLQFQIPWIVDELEEPRYEDRCPPCRKCRGVWRWKAFLKRESRLPGWYGVPEMAAAFRRPASKVRVSICLNCGDLTYQTVTV